MQGQNDPWIVAIGASGSRGLADIEALLAGLPANLPAIVMVVLHRLWDQPSHLRDVLARWSLLPVVIAAQSEHFTPGTVYIGEPAEHLTLAGRNFGALVPDPDRAWRNRTIDLLFASVARHAGPHMIGVVLSGSLDDGSNGLAAIHRAGGITMVLTPSAPPAHGMPESAIAYDGPIDLIAAAPRIAAAIAATCARPRAPTRRPRR